MKPIEAPPLRNTPRPAYCSHHCLVGTNVSDRQHGNGGIVPLAGIPMVFVTLILGLRAYTTITSRSVLGTSEYAMFARGHRDVVFGFPMVELIRSDGTTSGLLHPRVVLPIEAGHALTCIATVFFGDDERAKARFSQVIVSRLNQGAWQGRGERWPSLQHQARYTGIRIIGVTIDLSPLTLGRCETVTPEGVVFQWIADE
jgi:hypothetical protein